MCKDLESWGSLGQPRGVEMPRARSAVPEDGKPGLDLKASRFLSFFFLSFCFIYLFISGYAGSLVLGVGFL